MRRRKRFVHLSSAALVFLMVLANFVSAGPAYAEKGGQAPVNKLPSLLITEVVPDSTNGNGGDAYEFIELYNTTDQAINLNDYTIHYRYPSGPDLDKVWPIKNDVKIQPGETMVLWNDNGHHDGKTVADFNANYGTNLTKNKDIIDLNGSSMANSRERAIVLATNSGHEIAIAHYNVGELDTAENKGIEYKYPEDKTNTMVKVSGGTKLATPGHVDAEQVPDQLIEVKADTSAPTIENLTGKTETSPTKDVEIVADAEDKNLVKTFILYYKINQESNYKNVNLTMDRDDSLYRHSIDFLDFIGSDSIEYYFVASDGTNSTKSETYHIDVVENQDSPRLNVQDGNILNGETVIKGTTNGDPNNLKLLIDGSKVTDTFPSLEEKAYFVFEASAFSNTFLNAVTTGDKNVLRLLDNRPNGTVVVPVQPSELRKGNYQIAIRSGSKGETYYEDDPPTANLDDFTVWNIRLILADGTILRDPDHSDPEERLNMGNNGRFLPVVNFAFDIPEENLISKSYKWDTSNADDGEHIIKAVSPDGEASATVLVDNHGPAIQTTLEEGKQYKGEFTIDVTATGETSGLKNVEVKLDGHAIKVPYETSSADLVPGDHVLQVTAVDKAGNEGKKTVNFTSVEENPKKPEIVSPKDGATGVGKTATLNVKVTDPTSDKMDVTFNQGQKFNINSERDVKAFKGAADTEPAQKRVPNGEKPLTKEEAEKILSSDDQYFVTDATKKFPYVRFEINLNRDLNKNDMVQLHWEGKSLEGRKVTMYAWKWGQPGAKDLRSEGAWIPIDSFVAQKGEDFALTGSVDVESYVRHHKVNIMIQDEISPPEDYDYTFVWMSDTQFYTEVRPDIFKSEVNWIKNNAENMNIEYVFHTGDIVNQEQSEYQWNYADKFMGVLDKSHMPYGVLAGNHDVGPGDDYTYYYQHFGADRFKERPYYGGSYENNRGHYDLISENGNDYIMVYMGWGIGNEQMAWLNKVLDAHPNRKAILNFHEYLQPNGQRSAIGETIYQNVVVPNENVVAVLSGHFTGSSKLVSAIDDDSDGTVDRNVYQLLTDYQSTPQLGAGYMKLLRFDTASGKAFVTTYSPYLDDYNYYDPEQYPGKDEYTIDLNLEPQVKEVATDYFEANVYSHKKIGKDKNVASGQNAEVAWHGLQKNETYYWYVEVTDNFGGKTVSDLQQFTTGNGVPAPDHVRVEETDAGVKIAWDPVIKRGSNSITYEIYKDGKQIASTKNSTYTVKGINQNTEHEFTVVAKNKKGKQSEKVTVKP